MGNGGGGGYRYLTLLCHHRNDSALRWTCSDVGHFNVSFIHSKGQINTQDSVHKSQRLKRTESRSRELTDVVFNSQPNALPLGQPAPLKKRRRSAPYITMHAALDLFLGSPSRTGFQVTKVTEQTVISGMYTLL